MMKYITRDIMIIVIPNTTVLVDMVHIVEDMEVVEAAAADMEVEAAAAVYIAVAADMEVEAAAADMEVEAVAADIAVAADMEVAEILITVTQLDIIVAAAADIKAAIMQMLDMEVAVDIALAATVTIQILMLDIPAQIMMIIMKKAMTRQDTIIVIKQQMKSMVLWEKTLILVMCKNL